MVKGATNCIHFTYFFSPSSCLYVLFLFFLAALYVLVCFNYDIDTLLYTTNISKFHTLLSQVNRLPWENGPFQPKLFYTHNPGDWRAHAMSCPGNTPSPPQTKTNRARFFQTAFDPKRFLEYALARSRPSPRECGY